MMAKNQDDFLLTSTLLINKTRYALQAAVLIFYTKFQIN